MNIINAGNPSANNMIIRQVMQKKRQSSATIFDKLTKRTAKLTVKNPLNNVLTNDQLFRYYIQEVEPKLSQSNDNFSGLPNMTPPDNSIKDTIEKDFKDGYNAGSGGGDGGFGPLNSNDISKPRTLTGEEKAIRDYPLVAEVYFRQQQYGDQAGFDVLSNWYMNNKQQYNSYIDQLSRMTNTPVDDLDENIQEQIFSKAPYPLPMTDELRNTRQLVEMARKRQQDQNEDENIAALDQIQQQLERDTMINARLNRFDIAKEELGFGPDDVESFVDELYYGVDELDDGEEDEQTQAGPRITFYTQDDNNLRFSPARQFLDGVSFSQPPPSQLFNLFQPNVAAGAPNSARVSDSHVPKDVVVAGGAEKKKRAPYGSQSKSIKDREARTLDLTGTPPLSERTRSKKKPPVLLP